MDTNRIRLSIPATKTDKQVAVALCIYQGPDPIFKKSTERLFASATNIIS